MTRWNPFTMQFDYGSQDGDLDDIGAISGTKGDLIAYGTAWTDLAVGSNGQVLKADSGQTTGMKWDSLPPREYLFEAASLQAHELVPASLELLSGTVVKAMVRAFDDTTEEYINQKFILPSDLNTAGTVTFRAYVMAKVAAASKNIAFTFYHHAVNSGEDFDVLYSSVGSGDVAIDSTQDNVTEVTWTETVANLGWAASDCVFFGLSRPQASANNLSDDLYLFNFNIEVPRA